jgi:hypothetical protein
MVVLVEEVVVVLVGENVVLVNVEASIGGTAEMRGGAEVVANAGFVVTTVFGTLIFTAAFRFGAAGFFAADAAGADNVIAARASRRKVVFMWSLLCGDVIALVPFGFENRTNPLACRHA